MLNVEHDADIIIEPMGDGYTVIKHGRCLGAVSEELVNLIIVGASAMKLSIYERKHGCFIGGTMEQMMRTAEY